MDDVSDKSYKFMDGRMSDMNKRTVFTPFTIALDG